MIYFIMCHEYIDNKMLVRSVGITSPIDLLFSETYFTQRRSRLFESWQNTTKKYIDDNLYTSEYHLSYYTL